MSLCPHGYTAFWDCPICEEPMGTAKVAAHPELPALISKALGGRLCEGLVRVMREGLGQKLCSRCDRAGYAQCASLAEPSECPFEP
jgi:hypothetical protein